MGIRSRTRLFTAGALLGALAATLPAASATAAPAKAGLAMEIRASDPSAPAIVLTNNTGTSCQVIANALGTVGITSIVQDGKQITPIPASPTFPDALADLLAGDLSTLAPGASVTIPLVVTTDGPTGHVVESVTAADTIALAEVYSVRTGSPLTITATYSIPVATNGGPPLCPPAAAGSVDAVAGLASTGGGLPILAIVIAVVLLAALILIVILLARRTRRARRAGQTPGNRPTPTTGAAVVLLLVAAGAGALALPARPAYATLTPDPSLQNAFSACGDFGGDPAGILPFLNDPKYHIPIVVGGDTEEQNLFGNIKIYWDLNDHHDYYGGGSADPCSALYHEMYHAWQDLNGGQDQRECYDANGRDTGIRINEVQAVLVENKVRIARGLPPRISYDHHLLPPGGQCYPPGAHPTPTPTPTPTSTPNPPKRKWSWLSADPHVGTYDGLRYNFQAVGEFVATRDPSDPGFQVQERQQPAVNSTTVALTTAVAMAVGGDRVEVDITADGPQLLVNGTATPLGSGTSLPHGGTVALDTTTLPASVAVTWPDGSQATVTPQAAWGLRLAVAASDTHAGKLDGLLGNFDGNPDNDLVTAGNKTLAVPPGFGSLYPSFADHWRITDATSLFTYPAGTSTATYTDRSFPAAPPNVAGLSGAAAARTLCQSLGITDPQTLDDCVLDFAETGQATFATADLATQQLIGVGAPSAPVSSGPLPPSPVPTGPTASQSLGTSQEATLSVTQPHGVDKLTFGATKGQRLFVDILSATVPDQCGMVIAQDPDGLGLGNTCTANGTGNYGGILLTQTGTYTLVFAPANGATGQVHVRITLSTDIHATMPTDGTPVTVSITEPGQVAFLSFAGTVGERVVVEASGATMPDQCAIPSLRAPDGTGIGAGCLAKGSGFVDGTLLTTNGQFTVVVDPDNAVTGQVTLRLVVSRDVRGTITAGGPPVVATIGTPGQVALYTFTGTKGEKVTVSVTGGTLTPECGMPVLLATDGTSVLKAGCVSTGDSGGIDPVVLPASGTYTIKVNPDGLVTGTLTLQLTSG